MRIGWLAWILLVGCAPEPEVEVLSYRDQSVPIASQVDVVADDLIGRWAIRYSFAPFAQADDVTVWRSIGRVFVTMFDDNVVGPNPDAVDPGSAGFELSFAGIDFDAISQGRAQALVTSRWPQHDANRPVDFWVLWADFDRRTMAIGTPDGSFGFIIDRTATGGEDRISAALDIMSWMGYRTDEMVRRP